MEQIKTYSVFYKGFSQRLTYKGTFDSEAKALQCIDAKLEDCDFKDKLHKKEVVTDDGIFFIAEAIKNEYSVIDLYG
jgi:hypothetical protein